MKLSIEYLKQVASESYSRYQMLNTIGISTSGQNMKKLQQLLDDNNIDISHFKRGENQRKYKVIEKSCPVCGKLFTTTKRNDRKEKTVCSKSCAGTWFKTGKDNPNWKGNSYRNTAFLYHGKKCLVCDEVRILDVHHIDKNRNNNSPENIVPLCPTHHKYMHSKYKSEVAHIILEYLESKAGQFSKVVQ